MQQKRHMRSLITSLVVVTTLTTTGLAAQDGEKVARSTESCCPNLEGIMVVPTEDSAAPERLAPATAEQHEQQKQGSGMGKAIAIGAAVGAAVFVGFLVFIATAMN